jgi:hypothetical protein
MSTLKVSAVRGESGSADSIQLHATDQSVTFPGAVTVTGALSGAVLGADERQGYNRLKITNDGSNTNTIVTCDNCLLANSSGIVIKVSSVNSTINCTGTGANGLDTGSLAASKCYYVYIISNGTTTKGLASLSVSSPTMPSGYTYKARVGSLATDGSGNILRMHQINDKSTINGLAFDSGTSDQDYTEASVTSCPETAAHFYVKIATSGGTDTTSSTHQFAIASDSSGTFGKEWGRWWNLHTDNAMGDIRNSTFGPIPVVTVSAGVVKVWVKTWSNTGPNWTLSYWGHSY